MYQVTNVHRNLVERASSDWVGNPSIDSLYISRSLYNVPEYKPRHGQDYSGLFEGILLAGTILFLGIARKCRS